MDNLHPKNRPREEVFRAEAKSRPLKGEFALMSGTHQNP